MMNHIIHIIIIAATACILMAGTAHAQEKAWKKSATAKEFKTAMKEKRYDAASKAIDNAFGKSAEARTDAQLYSMKTEALVELITAENRKIYLNQRPDTARYFNLIMDLYNVGLQCDSIEIGKDRLKYRPAVANRMAPYFGKLVTAGKFFYVKKEYAAAFRFFEMYTSSAGAAVFAGKKLGNVENVASLAVLSAFGSNNHTGVMRYLTESLRDKQLESKLLEIGAKSAATLGDTTEMENLLENGFAAYPDADYFFLTLVRHYNDNGLYDRALTKAASMVDLHPGNRDFLFVKGKEEMLMHKWDDAIASFTKCTELNPDDAESLVALGNIYLQKAHDLYDDLRNQPQAEKKSMLAELYKAACGHFESVRRLKESDTALWLEGLRESYFNLNMGKELKALEKYK